MSVNLFIICIEKTERSFGFVKIGWKRWPSTTGYGEQSSATDTEDLVTAVQLTLAQRKIEFSTISGLDGVQKEHRCLCNDVRIRRWQNTSRPWMIGTNTAECWKNQTGTAATLVWWYCSNCHHGKLTRVTVPAWSNWEGNLPNAHHPCQKRMPKVLLNVCILNCFWIGWSIKKNIDTECNDIRERT